MCGTCGCGDTEGATVTQANGDGTHRHVMADGTVIVHSHDGDHGRGHAHAHGHGEDPDHPHVHEHDHEHTHRTPDGRTITHRHPHHHEHAHEHDHGGSPSHDHGDGDHPHHHDGDGHDHPHDPDELKTSGTASERIRLSAAVHAPGSADDQGAVVALEQQILAKNDALAARNRGWFAGRGAYALNVMSSPGAGKTTLLVRLIQDLSDEIPFGVIEGDQAMQFDADRIQDAGAPVVQVNTGKGCHLEADMVWRGLELLDPKPGSCVLVENVGNLVCPALFDLGESAKLVILSVTEGDDKPLKYPHMFRGADAVVITKIDLAPYVDFDVEKCLADVRKLRPDVTTFQVSAKTGEGLDAWYGWLRAQVAAVAGARDVVASGRMALAEPD